MKRHLWIVIVIMFAASGCSQTRANLKPPSLGDVVKAMIFDDDDELDRYREQWDNRSARGKKTEYR